MKLIIGLGNPGPRYARTRHNLGTMAADAQAAELKVEFKLWGQARNADLAQADIGGQRVLLVKPLTFMNLCGQAAVAVAHFFKVLPEEICAIHDDIDLPLSDVRLKVGGGDGGHNGLKSLTQSLGSSAYARIRMGIGRPMPPAMDPADFVLQPFGAGDWSTVEGMIQRALHGIAAFVAGADAFGRAMSELNRRAPGSPESGDSGDSGGEPARG